MRWHDERITRALRELYGNGGIQEQTVIPVMQKMRDDYEASILAHQAQAVKLAQRVAQLEEELQDIRDQMREELRIRDEATE